MTRSSYPSVKHPVALDHRRNEDAFQVQALERSKCGIRFLRLWNSHVAVDPGPYCDAVVLSAEIDIVNSYHGER